MIPVVFIAGVVAYTLADQGGLNPWFTVAWTLLALIGLSLEIVALRDGRRGDTLSEHVWAVFKVKDETFSPALRWLLRIPLLGALTWLTLHFVFGL